MMPSQPKQQTINEQYSINDERKKNGGKIMTEKYDAAEFLERLAAGALRTPLTCEGFAKPLEGNPKAFLFSLGTACENWTKISAEIIGEVEFLGERSCSDHSHPLVRIHIKEPGSTDTYAGALVSLLRATNLAPIDPQLLMQPNQHFRDFLRFADEFFNSGFLVASDGPIPNPGLGRLCSENTRKCHRQWPYRNISERERKRGCERMDDFC